VVQTLGPVNNGTVSNVWGGLVRRVVGYTSGAMLASLIYVTWVLASAPAGPSDAHESLAFHVGLAFFFWLFGGFALTLFLMIVPWIIAVLAYRRLRWPGPIYFPVVGSIFSFVIGCVAASIATKPLWIEDQTLTEGALIAAQRQGICFLASGLLFGASYWFLGERHVSLNEKQEFQ
jgi:hypothetical protein